MSVADTARLIASLELDPRKFIGGANAALGKLGQVEGRFGRLGTIAAQGARNAGANLARIGVVAAGAVTLAVRGGIQSLAELEDATTSVQGAIEQVGMAGQVTAQQVATWANEIETSVQAAFDDKEITQAATTLIRFGKVTSENLRPALVVMTDLATKTGSVDSAASLLAKALAAPEKAAGRLARVGIILTKEQQKQITAMVAAGDTAGAQALILRELEKATKDAAAASAGPYRDALNTLSDASEDAKRALAEGFLPIIQRVAKVLSEKVADPAFMEQIREFGRTLAGAFDRVLEIGGRLPWAQIGDSLKVAGAGAKAVFDAFAGLPPWIQTAVLTGWGLNKLTGGAIFKIGVELVSGTVEGVFKQFFARGATPANPLFVSDVLGGKGGIPPAAGGAAAGGGAIAGLLSSAGILAGFALIAESAAKVPGAIDNFSRGLNDLANKDIPGAKDALGDLIKGLPDFNPLVNKGFLEQLFNQLPFVPPTNARNVPFVDKGDSGNRGVLNPKEQAAFDKAERAAAKTQERIDRARDAIETGRIATVTAVSASQAAIVAKVGNARDAIETSRIATVTALGTNAARISAARDAIESSRIATTTALGNSRAAIVGGGHSDTDRIVQAINRNRPQIQVFVDKGDSGNRGGGGGGVVVRNGGDARANGSGGLGGT